MDFWAATAGGGGASAACIERMGSMDWGALGVYKEERK